MCSNYKRKPRKQICYKCHSSYDTGPFENMMGNGELAYSEINLYGDKYNLCPSCTKEIYVWLNTRK